MCQNRGLNVCLHQTERTSLLTAEFAKKSLHLLEGAVELCDPGGDLGDSTLNISGTGLPLLAGPPGGLAIASPESSALVGRGSYCADSHIESVPGSSVDSGGALKLIHICPQHAVHAEKHRRLFGNTGMVSFTGGWIPGVGCRDVLEGASWSSPRGYWLGSN